MEKKRNIWIIETTGLVLATFGLNYLANKYGDNLFLKFALGGSGIGLVIQVIRLGIAELMNQKKENKTQVSEVKAIKNVEATDVNKKKNSTGALNHLTGKELNNIDRDFGYPKRTRRRKK